MMKMNRTVYFILLLLLGTQCFAGVADTLALKTANIFQSNMVVQQNKPYAIWGKAAPGERVTVKADWTTKQGEGVTA
jgi:sialate O-acetylesterase